MANSYNLFSSSHSHSHSIVQSRTSISSGGEICAPDDVPDGRCDMHFAALALGLPLSLVQRRVNKQVVNYWAPFQEPYLALKKAMKYVFDKKCKRLSDYREVLSNISTDVFIVGLPNHTRVGGAIILLQESIRSLHALRYYATQRQTFSNIMPHMSHWRQLAEFEAIMRPAKGLCFDFQRDRVETGGEMILGLIDLQVDYDDVKIYDVVDVDSKTEWKPEKLFDELPRKKMTTDSIISSEQNIP